MSEGIRNRAERAKNREEKKNQDDKEAEKKKDAPSKYWKMFVRTTSSFVMFSMFLTCLWAGHVAVCGVLILLQMLVFRELVSLRYVEAKEKSMPYFRSLQWAWYFVAAVYAHGSTWLKAPMGVDKTVFTTINREILDLGVVSEQAFFDFASFGMFSAVFMASVLSLRPGLYEYQINQFTWTFMIILLVIVQMKTLVHNVFTGMFWFVFPFTLVMCNDTMAYFSGFMFGRKLTTRPFMALSPSKTWEGFIGGLLCTCVYAFSVAPIMGRYKPFGCSYAEIKEAYPELPTTCYSDYLWAEGTSMPIRLHAIVIALFVSLVAPFGGFLASAIKRASGIKDFDSIIPGHGGFMDRLDCQFVLFSFVHLYYSTFIAFPATHLSFAEVLSAVQNLAPEEQSRLIEALKA